MEIKIVEPPIVDTLGDVTQHIYAVDRFEHEKAVASVVLQKDRMTDYNDMCAKIEGSEHEVTTVKGHVGRDTVYEKTISESGPLGIHLPWYGFRVALTRRKATKRVTAQLKKQEASIL